MDPVNENSDGWQWCTAEGAELHSLLLGMNDSFREKLIWLEQAEELTLRMAESRKQKAGVENPKTEIGKQKPDFGGP